jgi:NAD(P)-dependent dehydrogenase (short-subunit alcohol dehydrogenase family)
LWLAPVAQVLLALVALAWALLRPGAPTLKPRTALVLDLAGPVVFLASPASDYVNGYTVAVDGGWLAR